MNRLRLGVLLCLGWLAAASALSALPADPAAPWKHDDGEVPGDGDPGGHEPSPALGFTPCRKGHANVYPCKNIDLASYMTLEDLGAAPGEKAAGIWGWTDPETRREYALIALRSRMSVVDVTDAKHPRFIGDLPGRSVDLSNREVNVYGDYAFVVADGRTSTVAENGVQVLDLTQVRGVTDPPVHFSESAVLLTDQIQRVHNLNVDAETGFAYAVGGNRCGGCLRMIDIQDPVNPRQVATWTDPEHAYIHDILCVVYHGPDERYTGREICFASAENALLILDVTDKNAVRKLSRTTYQGVGYAHQGWLTTDQKYFLLDDEMDELHQEDPHTTTYLWNLSDLSAPAQFATYTAATRATDHNQYVKGNFVYQSNYRAGLRILNLSGIADGNLTEVAYFDIVPDRDDRGYEGAWGNYPYFPSGTVVVSGVSQGLYVLKPKKLGRR